MTDGEKLVELIESISDPQARAQAYRLAKAFINGTEADQDELYRAAMSGGKITDVIPIIERIEAG